MSEFVLRLGPTEGGAGSAPISLYQVGVDEPIATDEAGFDLGPLMMNDQEIDLRDFLSEQGLLNRTRNQIVGEELWRRLTVGDIGLRLGPLVAGSGIYLDIPDTLTRYPWELLRHQDFWLFNRMRICLGRPTPSSGVFQGSPPDSDHPLRVLVVLGNDPDDPEIRATEELVAIEAAAHTKNDEVLLKTLLRPGSKAIEEALLKFKPHIFHFIGHGDRPDEDDPPQIEVFGSGATDKWGADRIRDVFVQSPPRLVVLNACLTGGAPAASTSLVNAFLDAGCLAVIAMMGEIRGDASQSFSTRFYAELFQGHPVQVAMATARRELANLADGEGDSPNRAQMRSNWVLPRLTVAGPVDEVAVMTRSAADAKVRWLRDDFVDRWDERWRVCQSMDGELSRLALVTGGSGMGKSELVNTVAEICARHGEKVLMVDFSGPRTGDWRDVLRQIAAVAGSEGLDATALLQIAEDTGEISLIIEKFQAELARLADDSGSMLVVLDGLGEWEAGLVRDILLPFLFGRYLDKSAPPPVRMVVTLRDEYDDLWPSKPRGWESTEVGVFEDEDWTRAIAHFESYWVGRVPPENRDRFMTMASNIGQVMLKTGESLELIRKSATILRGK